MYVWVVRMGFGIVAVKPTKEEAYLIYARLLLLHSDRFHISLTCERKEPE